MTTRPTTIAVLQFTSANESHGAGAADGCVEAVLEAGFRALERQQVAEILEERAQSREGEQGPEFYRRLGEMLGADAFIVGSVDQNGGGGNAGTIVARLISSETGDIVRIARLELSGWGDARYAPERARIACGGLLAE